jgi:HEAT repeat protein
VSTALKGDLNHANPANRANALRSLIKSEIDRSVIEGITLNKLKDDPSEEVKVAAAYVAGEMEFIELGSEILKQLKNSQNPSHIRVYLWALAKLRHTEAVDTILGIIVNPQLRDTEAGGGIFDLLKGRFDKSSLEYPPNRTYTPIQALRKLNVPFEIAAKTRELLIKYKAWSKTTATKEQRECYATLCAVALRYRDVESVPILLETSKYPDFLAADSPYVKVWYDFISYESITTSNDIRKEGDTSLFDDEDLAGLSPIDSRGASVADSAIPSAQFLSGRYSRHSNRLISNKFLLQLKPVFEMVFNQTSEQVEKNNPKYDPGSRFNFYPVPMIRTDVFSLLSRMPLEAKQLELLILRGFQDKDPFVREETARMVGVYKLKQFGQNIVQLIKDFNDNGIRHIEIACGALRELQIETKMCPK